MLRWNPSLLHMSCHSLGTFHYPFVMCVEWAAAIKDSGDQTLADSRVQDFFLCSRDTEEPQSNKWVWPARLWIQAKVSMRALKIWDAERKNGIKTIGSTQRRERSSGSSFKSKHTHSITALASGRRKHTCFKIWKQHLPMPNSSSGSFLIINVKKQICVQIKCFQEQSK